MYLDSNLNDTCKGKPYVKGEDSTIESDPLVKDEKITHEVKPSVKDDKKISNCFYIGMLFVISQMNFANSYIYCVPQSLQTPLREHFGIDAQQ